MNRLTLLVAFTCFALSACNGIAGPKVEGSGVSKTEPREIAGDITGIRTQSADVTVTVGEKQSVEITTDDNILAIISTKLVEGGVLEIKADENFSTRMGVKVKITVPELNSIEVHGSGDVNAGGLKAQAFKVDIRGSGDVKLEGTADSVSVRVDGSGDVDTTKLQAADANVKINGSGDVKVSASKLLSVQVNGSGDVRYTGNPEDVQKQINGSGSVKPM